jgi:arachidonate 15-lipoxygenase
MTRPHPAFDNALPHTAYIYNYTYVPPLAMIETVPAGEGFSSRPNWIFLVALSALKLLINAIMIDIRGKQGTLQYIEELVIKLRSLAAQLGVVAEPNLLKAFDGLRGAHAAPETLPEFKMLLEALATILAVAFTEQTLDGVFQRILQIRTPSAPATSLKDYNELFQFIPLPAVSQNFTEDSEFAAMRVAGPNPVVIERMNAPDSRFPVSEAQYQAVMGANDSLEKALGEGRLFLADYSVFNGSVNGSFPKEQKYNYAPLALFARPSRGKSLVPVAIQCAPVPSEDNPIFTPSDGYNWLIAKTIVQIADGNYHEAVSHLGRTHLFVEPFVIATLNQLSQKHPLSILLTPHFEGTLAINDAAASTLIAPQGGIDKLMSGSIDQSRVAAVRGAQSYLLNVNTSALPYTLAQRGVSDPAVLPDYPYRDDALLLWGAISQWVSRYINHYYTSDAGVENDIELQQWLAELVSHDGGRLNNIGDKNKLTTRTQLIELTTMICFTASAQPAAVNYPQSFIMSYAPAMPLAGYTPAPETQQGATEADFLKLLPPLDIAELQLNVGYLLGSVYYTRLGQYGDNYFTDPVIQGYLVEFQQALIGIEMEITQRNKNRTPYEVLLPSRIPQSINI